WQTQQVKINQQGPIAFYETPRGHGDDILKQLIMGGGYFNAIVYEGTPQKFIRAKRLIQCFVQMDVTDRDLENNAQVMLLSGTMFYHYFGDIIPGNSDNYQ
ncbi:hypothetical protein HZU77_016645, partial [Neisseriaceae bacterium TC5R-5]|nr:hypothetical protein [Neisseriaceae bacterium TC5R-5]